MKKITRLSRLLYVWIKKQISTVDNLIWSWLPKKKLMLLTAEEKRLFNKGERLIPKSVIDLEVIRHKSSYQFFYHIIFKDRKRIKNCTPLHIIDLGCGVGYGSKTLSTLRSSFVTGVDISEDVIKYAKIHFSQKNIDYQQVDLSKFISTMLEYDYVVSRGVLEHIVGGLKLARQTRWHDRLIFDVPYNEPSDINPHHLITKITEKHFAKFLHVELFYQDLSGIIYDQKTKPAKPNMIICIASRPGLPKVDSYFKFPIKAWRGLKIK